MAKYIKDARYTELFVTGSLESLLPQNAVARTIKSALERLDFSAFDAIHKNDEAGRPAVDPRSLVAVWILALMRGRTSSVALASECGKDIELRWLLGDAPVEKSTLCAFRKEHKTRISALGSQVLVALGQLGLLRGENLGVDGTIVRAASSRHSVRSRKGLLKQAHHLEKLLCEQLSEEDNESAMQEGALLRQQRKVAEALELMEVMGLTQEDHHLTTTEPSAKLLRQKDGSFAPGYNIQVVPDFDSGALIHAEVVETGSDTGQLQPQIEKAQAILEDSGVASNGAPSVAADGAYHHTRQLAQLEQQGIACYVPEDRNTHRKNPNASAEYQSNAFIYDADTDTFQCPQGQKLAYRVSNDTKTSAVYRAPASVCAACPAKQHCCPKTKGARSINRSLNAEVIKTVAQRVASAKGQAMKRARWITCEGAFARLNGLLHWGRCRLWDLEGVKAELAWRHFAHNLMLWTGLWKPMIAQPDMA